MTVTNRHIEWVKRRLQHLDTVPKCKQKHYTEQDYAKLLLKFYIEREIAIQLYGACFQARDALLEIIGRDYDRLGDIKRLDDAIALAKRESP